MNKINQEGVQALANQLVQNGDNDIAEKVENFEIAVEAPNIDFNQNLDVAEIEEIKEDVEELISDNPQFEAEPEDAGFNAIDLPEAAAENSYSENSENSYGENSENSYGENQNSYDVEPEKPYEPEIEQIKSFVDNAIPEINSDEGDSEDAYGADNNAYDKDSYAEDNGIADTGDETNEFGFEDTQEGESEIANVGEEESLNLERPIGETQELQSLRAESHPTVATLNNNNSQMNLDSFLPQVKQ